MKKLLTILIISLFTNCSKSQFFYHLIKNGVTSNVVSDLKNIRGVASTSYEAFGFSVQNKINQVTLYTNVATTHTTGASPYYRTLNIAARVWSEPTIIPYDSDSLNTDVESGGKMDNDSTVLFMRSDHKDIYHSRDIYIQKVDPNNNFSNRVLFDWTGVVKLQSGFFFGNLIPGDNAGESYNILYQANSDTGSTRYRISIFKTTNYWNTYSEVGVLYDGVIPFTETAGANLGGGNMVAFARVNNSGTLIPFESVNHGVSWTRRPSSNLNWYGGGSPEIPNVYQNATKDSFDVFYENRDASMMYISKGNTIANFGLSTPEYKASEIYAYHRGVGTNASLGYGTQLKLSNGLYLMVYWKEYTNSIANLQWTIDDLVTDPNGVPIAPTYAVSGTTTTSFRIDINNYTDTIWQNVRYMSIDLSTHADFSDFVTAKYRAISAFSASVIHDTRALAGFVIFNSLATGTTYYFRIKACNNAGCSAYTTTNVTTL